jgi:pimeloyl-ACP methyl ester carboxylesterase
VSIPLAIFEDGDRSRPTVVLVHGYPDTHKVWDKVAQDLAIDHHVVRYDVRGAGESPHPAGLREYRLDVLADDLFGVIDTTGSGGAVHLVGHDWGSIQGWHAATDPDRAAGRIATFTTISGPCLDHVAYWFRRRRRHPTPGNLAQLLGQYAKSWYIGLFHLPGVAPALMRLVSGDAVRGLALYRANMLPRLRHPQQRVARMPVQLIVLAKDRYVSQALAGADLDQWAPDLRRRTLAATHWSALADDAPLLGAMIREFIRAVAAA